jgi:TonB family protein
VLAQPLFHLTERADKPPELIKSVMPSYPERMRQYSLRAEVTVRFVVDINGNVDNPVISQSTNPAFNENALLAIKQWKFKPALRRGHPVNVSMLAPLKFQMTGAYDNGYSAYSTGNGTSASQDNGSAQVRNILDPVYPYDLLRTGVTGSANARMLVDKQGHVVFVEILDASQPQFGLALRAAVEGFTFDPAMHDGAPAFARVTYGHDFRKRDVNDSDDGYALDMEESRPHSICNYSQLDQPLKPISRSAPIYPLSMRSSGLVGTAVIEFLVNEKGHVCLPRIVAATAPEFGYAAAQAVSGWLFEPPMARGGPTIVRVRMPFKFKFKSTNPVS